MDIGISDAPRRPPGTPERSRAGGLTLVIAPQGQARSGAPEHDPDSVHQALIRRVRLVHPAHERLGAAKNFDEVGAAVRPAWVAGI